MPRILFDHQIFGWDSLGGIPRYFAELIAALSLRDDVELMLPALFARNALMQQCLGAAFPWSSGGLRWIARQDPLVKRVNASATARRLRRGDFDVAHVTYHDDRQLRLLNGKPYVFTVHDLIPEKLAEAFPHVARELAGKPRLVRGAARLIAVSEWTKADLVALYDIDPGRVEVIPHGISATTLCAPQTPRPRFVPDRFILYVGMRGGYKNFLGAAPAIANVLRRFPELHLLCVGGHRLSREEKRPFEERLCGDRVVRAVFSDQDLAWAYGHADALVFPSMYEGFGIPMIEAFANGCPVAASNRSALPEIGGDAARYFDPEDPADIEAALSAILADRDLRSSLIEAGRRRALSFSWTLAAERHLACYAKVV